MPRASTGLRKWSVRPDESNLDFAIVVHVHLIPGSRTLCACTELNAGISGLFLFTVLTCVHCSLWGQVKSPTTRAKGVVALVPFVGCESNGQVGPVKAPSGRNKTMAIPLETAQRLAYYKAHDGVGVLAPKGWRCFGTYGSNGATLYVTPYAIHAVDLFSTSWKGFTGPVIQISSAEGDTSGRFEVAKTIARAFPAHKAFVEGVIAEGIEPASSFPYGPYPADTLKYRGENIVEFQTPAQTEGFGTASRLQKNDSPIYGVAILFGEESNVIQLSVRLPSEASDLTQLIAEQTEREAARFGN